MTASEHRSPLVGVWQLESFDDLDAEGGRHEGPLGPDPAGLLFYSASGEVSVTMMRTAPGEGSSYMSYAGSWKHDGDQVVHQISLAPDPAWIGSEQVRELGLVGEHLFLTGLGPSGSAVRRTVCWRRVSTSIEHPG